MRETNEILKKWLDQETLDQGIKEELLVLRDEDDIQDRFYRDLEFGTGGLRGVLGAGTNRMNIYTVRKATQGLADYINLHYGKGSSTYKGEIPSAAIAFDSRINSDLFALEAACVLAANGIKSYIYPELMPTPALSFAVRHYGCSAGIMVTASHNPAKYNGYKVYNEEGCQMTLETAAEVLQLIGQVDIFKDVKTIAIDLNLTLEEKSAMALAISDDSGVKLIEVIPPQVGEAYLQAVQSESTGAVGCKQLSVVYSPLNGTGNKPVRQILDRIGVKDVKIVEEQEMPDGNFTTCPNPNPEKKEALALGLKLCEELAEQGKAPDLLLATDPDCDRVGIAVRRSNREAGEDTYQLLSGNETGILLLDFICQRRLAASEAKADKSGVSRERMVAGSERVAKRPDARAGLKEMPKEPIAIKTIVTSKMAEKVAKQYGVKMMDVLTGFKFIGEQIGYLEAKGEEDRYIFGFEESYGYLSGSYVRDKDAVNAAMLICEMAAYYKTTGITLVDRLQQLYEKFGFYKNDLIEFTFEGAAGMEKMSTIMENLRAATPKNIIGKKVVEAADYQTSQRRVVSGAPGCVFSAGMRPINLPKADVLEYILEDGSSFIVRPSGTEPKLKIYLSAKGSTREESDEIINNLKTELGPMI